MTEYIVLATTDPEQPELGYNRVGQFEARDARSAVAAYVKQNSKASGGTYIAVPTRSFKPITVATETQTKLVFT
jgi:hypothetical protein